MGSGPPQILVHASEDPLHAFAGPINDYSAVALRLDLVNQGEVFLIGAIDQIRDGLPELGTGFGQPDGMQVAADEIFVRQVDSRWAHRAGNHPGRLVEEVLVVR